MNKIKPNQTGFTLIELLVAMAITGILGVGIFTALFQIRNVSDIDNAHMDAVKQVENAVHYLNRDFQMSQAVEQDGVDEDFGEYWLRLSWTTWDNNYLYKAIYIYQEGSGTLVRKLAEAPGEGGYTLLNSSTVAAHITSYSATAPDLEALPVEKHWILGLNSTVTSGSKQASETRELRVIPRPGS